MSKFQFQIPQKQAEAIAKRELESLFGTESRFIRLDDPAQILRKELRQNDHWTDDFLSQTKVFYKKAEKTLVKEIPMRTYLKHRYNTGLDLELMEKGEFPEQKDIWTLNTARIVRKRFNIRKLKIG